MAAIAHAAAEHPDDIHGLSDLDTVLSLHPMAALAARLCHPPGDWLRYDIGRLLGPLDEAALEQALAILGELPDTIIAAAGIQSDDVVLPETADAARQYVASALSARQGAAVAESPPRPRIRSSARPAAEEALASGDWDAVMTWPPEAVRADLPEDVSARLQEYAVVRLRRLLAAIAARELACGG